MRRLAHRRRLVALPLLTALGAGLLPGVALAVDPATSSLVVDSTADTVAADGHCTLREALINADTNGQVVPGAGECAAGYGLATITFSVGGVITLGSPLSVGSPVEIDGGTDGIGVSGASSGTILLASGATVLRHLALRDATDTGAVTAGDSLLVEDCTFADNSTSGYGGAINASGPLTVLRSTFTGNHAGGAGGGAVVATSGATITDSSFSDNSATLDAGAVVLGGTSSVLRTTFAGNTAGGGGGAMLLVGTSATVDSSTFSTNTSKGGGAIVLQAGSLSLVSSVLTGNVVTGTSGGGGAVYAVGSTSTAITNSTLSGNIAPGMGGAVGVFGALAITDSTISGNTSGAPGGGVMSWSSGATITGAAIMDNVAPGAGGLAIMGGTLTLANTYIGNNTATGAASSVNSPLVTTGGGIGAIAATVTITGSTISGNTAAVDGGGVEVQMANITIGTTTLAGNLSQAGSGGGLMVDPAAKAVISRSTVSGNTAGNGGGIFSAGQLDVANTTIAHNHAAGGGGALTGQGAGAEVTGTTAFSNVTIALNTADSSGGGGLLVPPLTSTPTLVNSIVVGNTKGGGTASDVDGALGLYHHNVIGIPEGKTLADILDTDGLADNGGPTKTIGIAAASPARDAGEVMVCISAAVGNVDQRGRAREALCDIGAVEEESVAPTSTTPLASMGSGVTLPAGIPVRLTWTGADDADGVGIDHYDIERSVNGGAWKASGRASGVTAAVSIAAAGSTRFRVRAVDRDGNLGAWHAGATLQGGSLVQQTASSVRWSGAWTTAGATSFSGGSVRWAKAAGAGATFSFTGRGVALVSTQASNRGKVRIYAGSTLLATVDLGGTTAYRRVVWAKTWATSATRSIRVVVVGTAGRPRVDVDAFVVLK